MIKIKDYEKVIKAVNEKRNVYFREIIDEHFNGSLQKFTECLSFLSDNGLVEVQQFLDGPDQGKIYATEKGMAYFLAKSESKSKKWSERRWDLVKIAIGYGLGVLSHWLWSR